MSENTMAIVDKLEELDRQLTAFDAVMALAGSGAAAYGNGDMIQGLTDHVRSVITDLRAGLDEIGSAVMAKERMSA